MSWKQISCVEREALVDRLGRSYNGLSDPYGVIIGRSDLDGEFGEPSVMSVWGHKETEVPVLKDERWPESDRKCEHYEFVEDGW